MVPARILVEGFERNMQLIRDRTEGLTHAESLVQTPYRVNCLNWTLGHILHARGPVLDLLGVPRVVPAAETERYGRDSEPVVEDGPGVLRMEDLLDRLEETQARITDALEGVDEAALAVITDKGDGTRAPLGELIHYRLFHDTFHTAHTDILRQVALAGRREA